LNLAESCSSGNTLEREKLLQKREGTAKHATSGEQDRHRKPNPSASHP
jgi:hypothetical protein